VKSFVLIQLKLWHNFIVIRNFCRITSNVYTMNALVTKRIMSHFLIYFWWYYLLFLWLSFLSAFQRFLSSFFMIFRFFCSHDWLYVRVGIFFSNVSTLAWQYHFNKRGGLVQNTSLAQLLTLSEPLNSYTGICGCRVSRFLINSMFPPSGICDARPIQFRSLIVLLAKL
jgi:hypothetical protein